MSRIFWDTNLLIYLIEGKGELFERTRFVAERMLERGDQLCTSTFTLGELLVKPVEKRDEVLRQTYERILARHVLLIPFDTQAARIYAHVRQDRSVHPPDAIQLSCAAAARVDLFITNDDRLNHKVIPGIQFVTSLRGAFV